MLPDPEDGTTLRVTAPQPPRMAAIWQALGFDAEQGEKVLQALLAYHEGLSVSPAKGLRPLWRSPARRPVTPHGVSI